MSPRTMSYWKTSSIFPQVAELRQIEQGENNVSYGAGLSLEEVKHHSMDLFPALYDCLEVFGSYKSEI